MQEVTQGRGAAVGAPSETSSHTNFVTRDEAQQSAGHITAPGKELDNENTSNAPGEVAEGSNESCCKHVAEKGRQLDMDLDPQHLSGPTWHHNTGGSKGP